VIKNNLYVLIGSLAIAVYTIVSVTGYEPFGLSQTRVSPAKMRQAGGARAYFSSAAYYHGGK